MKIRTQFILFIILIHVGILLLSFLILNEHKIYFILSEFLILGSIYLSYRLYKELINPIQLISTGIDAITDRDFNVKFLKTGSAEMDKLVGIYNQMVDNLREERTKQQQQHFFLDKLIQTSPVGILILDFDNHISSVNPKAFELLNLKAIPYKNVLLEELEHPLSSHLSNLKTGESRIIQLSGVKTFKCQKSHFVDRGFNHHFLTIEELTTEILEAEKKAYGKVIRMMAHEVNNSIGAINSILDSLKNYTSTLAQGQQETFENALEVSIQRNDRLNIFMRNFADIIRLPAPYKEVYDLIKLLEGTIQLMQFKAQQKQIKLLFEKPDAPFNIMIDVAQMEQVLINITKNAIEAIKEKGQVIFEIDSKSKTLLIRDNGSGISKEIESKLFTPFFSTKREGQGIGLTLIREILLGHNFKFSLENGKDGWTEFLIEF